MINQNERLYYRGTVFEVTYEWEGRIDTHQSILVETHDEGFVFVVVQINELKRYKKWTKTNF